MLRGLVMGVLLLAPLGAVGWLVLRESGLDAVMPAPRDRIQMPVPVPRTRIAALGRVDPRSEEVHVGAAMTGRLSRVLVGTGDSVSEHQVIAMLENAELIAGVRAAAASLAAARASRERLLNGARAAEREEAEAAVKEAQAVLELANQELARQRGLQQRDLGSGQELDQADSAYRVAVARLARSRHQYEVIASPPRTEDVARADADVALAQAHLDEALAMLDKSLVRSPIDGRVLRVLRHAGEKVTLMLDTPVAVIGDTSTLRIRAEVDEADIGLIALGQPVVAVADAYGDERFYGRVSRIGELMGRKALHADEPGERIDTRVLEVLVDLEAKAELPVGLRMDTYFALD